MAAGSMKDIKLRIKSVQGTMQITKAMELVASSKLRRAKERMENSRPYFMALHRTLNEIAVSNRDFSSPFMKPREVKNTCYVVIAGDRGLAGGYNANVFKLVAAESAGKDYCVLPIGKKALELYQHRGVPVISTAFGEAADLSVSDCFEMARILSEQYLAGKFDEIYVVYTNFVSMLTQNAAVLRLLPFVARDEMGRDVEATRNHSLILYEPDSETVFNEIIPEYVSGIIYGALCESVASELAARRTAMDSATKNASQMIDNLNLYYNRARQAAITQEISEIVAGAEQS